MLATGILPTVKFKETSAEVITSACEDSASGSGKSMGEAKVKQKILVDFPKLIFQGEDQK